MKIFRRSIAVFLWICISALLIMILMKFRIPLLLSKIFVKVDIFFDSNKEFATLIYDIFLGVFCSSIVVLFSACIYYKYRKSYVISRSRFFCGLYYQDLLEYIQLIFGKANIKAFDTRNTISILETEDLIKKVVTDYKIMEMTKSLKRQRNDFLSNINDFYPILRKSKKNLVVSNLLQYWHDIHTVIEQCYLVYQIYNNIFFEQDYDKNLEWLKLALKLNILAQTDKEELIKNFGDKFKELIDLYPPKKSNISKKCL